LSDVCELHIFLLGKTVLSNFVAIPPFWPTKSKLAEKVDKRSDKMTKVRDLERAAKGHHNYFAREGKMRLK